MSDKAGITNIYNITFKIPTDAFAHVQNGTLTITASGVCEQPKVEITLSRNDDAVSPPLGPDACPPTQLLTAPEPQEGSRRAPVIDDDDDQLMVTPTRHNGHWINDEQEADPVDVAPKCDTYASFRPPDIAQETYAWNVYGEHAAVHHKDRCSLTGDVILPDHKRVVWVSSDGKLVLVYSWRALLNILEYNNGVLTQPPSFNRVITERSSEFFPSCLLTDAQTWELEPLFVKEHIDGELHRALYQPEVSAVIDAWREATAHRVKGNLRACPICYQWCEHEVRERDLQCIASRNGRCHKRSHSGCHNQAFRVSNERIPYDPVAILEYIRQGKHNPYDIFYKSVNSLYSHLIRDHYIDLAAYDSKLVDEVVLDPMLVRDPDGILTRMLSNMLRLGIGYTKMQDYWSADDGWRVDVFNTFSQGNPADYADKAPLFNYKLRKRESMDCFDQFGLERIDGNDDDDDDDFVNDTSDLEYESDNGDDYEDEGYDSEGTHSGERALRAMLPKTAAKVAERRRKRKAAKVASNNDESSERILVSSSDSKDFLQPRKRTRMSLRRRHKPLVIQEESSASEEW